MKSGAVHAKFENVCVLTQSCFLSSLVHFSLPTHPHRTFKFIEMLVFIMIILINWFYWVFSCELHAIYINNIITYQKFKNCSAYWSHAINAKSQSLTFHLQLYNAKFKNTISTQKRFSHKNAVTHELVIRNCAKNPSRLQAVFDIALDIASTYLLLMKNSWFYKISELMHLTTAIYLVIIHI